MMSVFNGCRTKLDFFTVCMLYIPLLGILAWSMSLVLSKNHHSEKSLICPREIHYSERLYQCSIEYAILYCTTSSRKLLAIFLQTYFRLFWVPIFTDKTNIVRSRTASRISVSYFCMVKQVPYAHDKTAVDLFHF